MKALYTIILLIYANLICGQTTLSKVILFDHNKYSLKPNEENKLLKFLDSIEGKEIIEISIVGHADNDGSIIYNQNLSLKRATAIKEYLFNYTIESDKISVSAKGESEPKLANSNDYEKSQNRRVQINVKYLETNINSVTRNNLESIDEYIKDVKPQIFIQDASSEIRIKGKDGTLIVIPPNSLEDSLGISITGSIIVELKEYYRKSDMILNGLQTLSNKENILETAGMINIIVKQNNIGLELKNNSRFLIQIPNKKQLELMDFFSKTEEEDRWERNTWTERDRDDEILEKYIFNSSKFGWINCDRFVEFDDLTEIIANVNDTIDTRVCMVFQSINSILNYSEKKNGYIFRNVPIGEQVSIIAFKLGKGKMFYAQENITIGKGRVSNLELKEVSKDLFDKLIMQFN